MPMLDTQIVSEQLKNKHDVSLIPNFEEQQKSTSIKKNLRMSQSRKLRQASIKSSKIHLKFIQLISGFEFLIQLKMNDPGQT